jgi:hypothetical protein
MSNLYITLQIISIVYLLYMSWIFNVKTNLAFFLYKLLPFVLALTNLFYFLLKLGFILKIQ